MTGTPKDEAIRQLESAGAEVGDYEYTLYADGECSHCGSRFSYGSIHVADGVVDSGELRALVEEIERRDGNDQ